MHKRLEIAVTIKTVNSNVDFTACIKTSIWIHQKSFSHNFYLVDIPNPSNFQGILGFEFINKN